MTQLIKTNSGNLSLSVSDSGTVLSLLNVTTASVVDGSSLSLNASGGGQILLPHLTTQSSMDDYVQDPGSVIDLSGWSGPLRSPSSVRTYLEARTGGAISIPNVSSLEHVRVIIRDTGQIPMSQMTSFRNGEFRLDGATLSLPGLTDVLGTDLILQNGAQLTLSGVTQLGNSTSGNLLLSASDVGTLLRLPNAVSAILAGGATLQLRASGGAQISLPKLGQIQPLLDAYVTDENSVLDLSGLNGTLRGTSSSWTYLEAEAGGVILIPNVSALADVRLILRSHGLVSTAQLTAITDSSVTIDGTQVGFGALADTNGTTFQYLNGATASFPTPADLIVSNILGPATVVAGQPVPLVWEVTNLGSAVTNATWSDGLFLSGDARGGNDQFIGLLQASGDLPHGAARRFTNSVAFPAAQSGTWYLVVAANQSRTVFEGTNTFNNTNISTVPIQIQAPDLVVSAVSLPSGTAVLGQSVSVSWTVQNVGSAAASAAWMDRLWLSQDPQSLAGAIPLFTHAASNPLAAGASYSAQANVVLPITPGLSAGNYWIVVQSDSENEVAESVETNNTRAAGLSLALPPLPDLAVTSLKYPANAAPGQTVQFVWTVTNRGPATAHAPWSEGVLVTPVPAGVQFVVAAAGALPQPLFWTEFTNDIPAGGFLVRTEQVVLPADLAAGQYNCSAEVDHYGEVLEPNEANNTFVAAGQMVVAAALVVQLPITALAENAVPGTVNGLIFRNGDVSLPLTVNLTSPSDGQVTTPASVVIPVGALSAGFTLTVHPDGVVRPDRTVLVTAAATGYQSGTAAFTVRNVDLPQLGLQVRVTSLVEGQSSLATLIRSGGTSQAAVVGLNSPNADRISFPDSVTIPAGQSSITFTIAAMEDSQVEPPLPCTLQAAAPGYQDATASFTVLDNDLPQLAFSLGASTISEAAGPQATSATISRGTATPRSLTIRLQNSNPAAVSVPDQVVIPAGQASVAVPVGAINNSVVDGTKTAVLQAFAQADTGAATVASSPSVVLTIMDDDGPALAVTAARDLVAYGVTNATTITVSRNTTGATALTVTLSTSDASRVVVPASVTIPAGEAGATVPVSTLSQPALDGTHAVKITAAAPGYTSGSAVLNLSDLPRPDLIVTDIAGPDTADTESSVNVSFRVVNQGLAPAGTNWTTRTFLAKTPAPGQGTLLAEYVFNGTLPVGEYFGQSRQVQMPVEPGDYWVVVSTDVSDQISEILENNNTAVSSKPIHVNAAYSATVQADLKKAKGGTPIPLHGQAIKTSTGGPAADVLVNVHIHLRGTHRVIAALTDQSGAFSATFTPLPGEAGIYEIGAAHPGATDAPIQDSFTLLGMKVDPVSALAVAEQSSVTAQVLVQNLGDAPLSGLTATVVSNAPNLQITASLSSATLGSLGNTQLGIAVTAADSSTAQSTAVVRIMSAEGATLDVAVPVSVSSIEPRLVIQPGQLVAGMKVGGQAFVQFDVVNQGASTSGPVQVVRPVLPWLHVATANPLPPLAPGATNHVMLQLTPAADLALGPYEGTLVVQGGVKDVSLPFTFRALSEAKGDLRITAVDEYTYYAAGAPKVSGAEVSVLDAVSEQLVSHGTTDTNGQFLASQLPEGYYEVHVKADQHKDYQDIHLVIAGQETNVTALLPRIAVQYIWTVTPTQIQDRTKITIETVFESFVPMPVVTVDPALIDLADVTADVTQIDLRITNHGLVAAQDAHLSFGTHPDWSFGPLIEDLGQLPARSTLVVPLLIRKTAAGSMNHLRSRAVQPLAVGGSGCDVAGGVVWRLPCGLGSVGGSAGIQAVNAGGSGCGGDGGGFGGGGGPGLPTRGSGGAGSSGSISSSSGPGSCDPCLLAALKCAADFAMPDAAKCAFGAYNCIGGMYSKGPSWEGGSGCISTILACMEAAEEESLAPINLAIDAAKCAHELAEACGPPEGSSEGGGGGQGSGEGAGGEGSSTGTESLRTVRSPRWLLTQSSTSSHVERPELAILRQRADWVTGELGPIRYVFGDDAWFNDATPSLVKGWLQAFLQRTQASSEAGVSISSAEAAQLLAVPLPQVVTPAVAQAFIDRWNRSIAYWQAGIFEQNQVAAGQNPDFIALDQMRDLTQTAADVQAQYTAAGFSSSDAAYRQAYADLTAFLSEGSGQGVCAHVRIRLEQELVSTRDAFDATLEIDNQVTDPLQNLGVDLKVRRRNGDDASALFAIYAPDLTGINAVDGSGTVGPQSSAKIHWLVVPTTDAAVNGPEEFLVSGTLHYHQGQLDLTVPLAAARITVYPSPSLKLKYFHQRDVFGDDPFTPEVEPSVPFSLAVMVENNGHGAAQNVRITSAQPQIVDNQKGLLVDFKIIATQVESQSLTPSLTADFGQIDPGTNVIGRWLLTSSLLGGFIDYSASLEHLDGLGQKKLSVVDGIEIHELIHIVRAPGPRDDGRPDFLVNDVPDFYSRPDTVHLSDGSVEPVSAVTSGSVDAAVSSTHLQVSLTASTPTGWVYLQVPDPGGKQFQLVRVVRSDGVELALGDNVWRTDRTFLGNAKRPLVENVLHFFDWNSTGRYTLTYAPASQVDAVAPTSQVAAMPAESPALIPVSWSGADNAGGSGIASFDVFVSVDGGAFTPWMQNTVDRSGLYQGALGKQYAFYSVAMDVAGNREAEHTTADAETTVTKVNHPPVLAPIADQVLHAGDTLNLQASASDPDGDSLVFSLDTNAPPGAVIEPYTGAITWITGPGIGGGTSHLTIQVLDNGSPRLGAVRQFAVTILTTNTPPGLAPIANQTTSEGHLLSFTAQATDADLPPQKLTFSLAPGAPAGASIDAASGVFSWRPTSAQGGTTNQLALVVQDSGTPSLSATQTFTVVVLNTRSDFVLQIGSTNVVAGQSNSVPLVLTSAADLAHVSFGLALPDSHVGNVQIIQQGADVTLASMQPAGDGSYRVDLTLDSAHAQSGERTVGRISFDTQATGHSAVAGLNVQGLGGVRLDGQAVTNTGAQSGRIFVLEKEPLLDAVSSDATHLSLTLYGQPGNSYRLQRSSKLGAGAIWTDDQTLRLSDTFESFERSFGGEPFLFFRIVTP